MANTNLLLKNYKDDKMNKQSQNEYLKTWNNVFSSDFFQNIFKPIFLPVIIFIALITLIAGLRDLLLIIFDNFVTFIGVLMLIAAFFTIWLIPTWQTKNLKVIKRDKKHSVFELEKERIKLRDDTRKTLAQIIGGAFFVFSLFVAYNTFQLNRESQLATKFIEAIKLIGSENFSQRAGGLLTLEDISKNSFEDYPTIIEFLSMHIRERSKEIKKFDKIGSDTNNNISTDFNTNTNVSNTPSVYAESSEIEQVINTQAKVDALRAEILLAIGIVKRRNIMYDPKDFILQLEGSEIIKADLKNANFSKANFQNANLSETDFSNTNLSETDFRNATLFKTIFDERTKFSQTRMENTDLSESTISLEQLFKVIINENSKLPETYKQHREELLSNSRKLVTPVLPVRVRPVSVNFDDLMKQNLDQRKP